MRSVFYFSIFVLQILFFLTGAGALSAACIEEIKALDEAHYFPVFSGEWAPNQASRPIPSQGNSVLIVSPRRGTNVAVKFSAVVRPTGTNGWSCRSKVFVIRGNERVVLSLPVSRGNELVLVGPDGFPPFDFRLMSDTADAYRSNSSKIIRRPIDVIIFENHPEAGQAKKHTLGALAIWRKAGIHFEPRFQYIRGKQIEKILGRDRIMEASTNYVTQHPDEQGDVNRIWDLKTADKRLSIVFAKSSLPGELGTRGDRRRQQVYIAGGNCDGGFPAVIAHELGHLLLGAGHTGKPNVKWTSTLMRECKSLGTGISDADAKLARERARRLAPSKSHGRLSQ